jgi:6-phosphogluconolactonase/glucosamine-6-phosphate isomerase/deaminase
VSAEESARTSLTMEFINAARVVAVIAGGAERRDVVSLLGGRRNAALPATHLKPLAGELRWYLDNAACQPRES